jgi:hypothetical protein
MRELWGTAAEYLGYHTPPYEVESGGEELRFEGGLLKISAPNTKGSEQKHIYRPRHKCAVVRLLRTKNDYFYRTADFYL